MYGENILIGYAKQKVDEKNRIILPAFTKAEPGDSVILIPEENDIAIYSSIKLNEYFEKIKKLDLFEQQKLLKEFRKYCESIILETTVDSSKRILLSKFIQVVDGDIEIIGSGDRVLMKGNIFYPNVYKKRS